MGHDDRSPRHRKEEYAKAEYRAQDHSAPSFRNDKHMTGKRSRRIATHYIVRTDGRSAFRVFIDGFYVHCCGLQGRERRGRRILGPRVSPPKCFDPPAPGPQYRRMLHPLTPRGQIRSRFAAAMTYPAVSARVVSRATSTVSLLKWTPSVHTSLVTRHRRLDKHEGPGMQRKVGIQKVSEVGLDVVFTRGQPCFQRRDKRVLADLYEPGGPQALVSNHGGGAGNQRLLGHPVQIARAPFHVSPGLVQGLPRKLGEASPLLGLNRSRFRLLCLRGFLLPCFGPLTRATLASPALFPDVPRWAPLSNMCRPSRCSITEAHPDLVAFLL
jgi:hypothetical protein